MRPSNTQLIECFDVIFESVHSDSFKVSEMKYLIYSSDSTPYYFAEKPRDGWEIALRLTLKRMGFDLDILRDIGPECTI